MAYATNPSREEVVLKLLSKSSGDKSEIDILHSLHAASDGSTPLHNHIIPFTAVLSTERGSIIATPCGTPLKQFKSNRKLSVPVMLNIGQQLLEAVHFMHSRGIAHRDLKPANVVVMLHDGGEVSGRLDLFVIDFNLARRVQGRHVLGHGFVGTEGHTALEVDDDSSYSIIEADLWALGYIIEEMILSNGGLFAVEVEPLRLACQRLMDSRPARRPSAGEILEALRVLEVGRLEEHQAAQ